MKPCRGSNKSIFERGNRVGKDAKVLLKDKNVLNKDCEFSEKTR